jgi:hypothetical protein
MRTSLAMVTLAVFLGRPIAALEAQADSVIAVRIAVDLPEAQARVTRAMIAEGLSVLETASGLVIAQGTAKGNSIDVKYTAVILPAASFSDVAISAVATAKAQLAGAKIEGRVTSKLKGGKDVWARMQRIAERTTRAPPVSAYPPTPALAPPMLDPSAQTAPTETTHVVGRIRTNEQLLTSIAFRRAIEDVQRLGIVIHYQELRPDTLSLELGDAAFTAASTEYNLGRLYLAYRGTTHYSAGGALELQHGERQVGLYTKAGLSWEGAR